MDTDDFDFLYNWMKVKVIQWDIKQYSFPVLLNLTQK